nr:ribonuclease H-like domain-containing protein [Tanacetum cinerariifolium]
MQAPLQSYMDLVLRVLKYLKDAPRSGVNYEKSMHMSLKGYADSDWAKCYVTKKSTSVSEYYVFFNSCMVSWKSKKQSTLSKSFAEAEYRSMAAATCEVMRVVNILKDLKVTNLLPAELYCDNSAAIQIATNPKGLDIFFYKFHILEDVHPQLHSPNQTIHEMPIEKIGVIPDSLTKVSHFEILCRVHNIEPTVDSFACPASVPWHTDKNVSKYPFPKSIEFNEDDYAILVAHLASFRECSKPILCLVGMSHYYTLDEDTYLSFFHDDRTDIDLFAFIQVADPTTVKVVERERAEGRACSSAPTGFPSPPKRQHKKRPTVTDASGSSHPPKKLRGDYETSSGAATGGKFSFVLKELLASSIPNVEAGVEAMTTLTLVTSSVSTTPGCKGNSSHHSSTYAFGAEVDSIIRSGVLPPVITEAVVTSHVISAPSISVPEMGTKMTSSVHASMFHDSDFTKTEFVDHLAPFALFSQIREMDYHHLFTEFNVGTARQACLNAEVTMRTEYYLSMRGRLESEYKKQADLLKAGDDEVENLKAQLLLKEAEVVEATRLCTQVYAVEAAKRVHVTELQSSVSTKDLELKDFNITVSSLKSKNDNLVDQVYVLETTRFSLRDQVSRYERLKKEIEELQDAQMNIDNDKVAKLDADLLEMALHLEEKFYPHLLTTISGRRWLLTHGQKLAVIKCLNLLEY